MSKIWWDSNFQKQPKMILENPIKSQIADFQKRIPEYSRYYQKIPPKLSLIFLEIFQKDLFVLKYERYHLDLEIVEDICRHLYMYTLEMVGVIWKPWQPIYNIRRGPKKYVLAFQMYVLFFVLPQKWIYFSILDIYVTVLRVCGYFFFFELFDSSKTSFSNSTIEVLRGPIFHA